MINNLVVVKLIFTNLKKILKPKNVKISDEVNAQQSKNYEIKFKFCNSFFFNHFRLKVSKM